MKTGSINNRTHFNGGSLRSVRKAGANGAFLEASGGVLFGQVVPSATVDFLAANEPEAGIHKVVLQQAETVR